MMKSIATLAAVLAAAPSAWGQAVKDFAEVDGARANKLYGYGLVTGLNGNGDSPQGESARVLRNLLQNLVAPEAAVERVNARNAALVLVTAELPAFQKQGTRLDVAVTAVGDAKSLAGGELQLTDLRGPAGREGPIHALASGKLVLPGRGNPTTGVVPSGAIVERELEHAFVSDKTFQVGAEQVRRKAFKLLLKKPDLGVASELVRQINSAALTGAKGRRMDVAVSLDGGSILVRVPTSEEFRGVTGSLPEADYELEPVRWIDAVLNVAVTLLSPEAAGVVLDDATKTVSWTGDVRLRRGSVMLAVPGARPTLFHAEEGERLSDFLKAIAPSVTEQQLVDAVKALHHAGLVQAEVRSR